MKSKIYDRDYDLYKKTVDDQVMNFIDNVSK